jgi:hypothetical protein
LTTVAFVLLLRASTALTVLARAPDRTRLPTVLEDDAEHASLEVLAVAYHRVHDGRAVGLRREGVGVA